MKISDKLPGLILVLLLAALASALADSPLLLHTGLSALSLAILGGMLLGNTLYPRWQHSCGAGVALAQLRLLRLGIVLYGCRLSFADIASVGATGILSDLLVLSSTFALACWLGTRYFGLDAKSAMLIGAGSSICGAAAVLATEPVVQGGAEKVSVAVATVMVFGSASMFLYPLLFQLSSVHPHQFGIYVGSTVHEVAQVVVAAHGGGGGELNAAVITKMIRVMMLAPFLILLSAWLSKAQTGGAPRPITIPWFALGFIACAGLHSIVPLPVHATRLMAMLDNVLLAMAMGALGLNTRIAAIRRAGIKPLALAGILFVYLVCGGALINDGVARCLG
jgi:uncharacterized integral membrane protein (TIGR00698 family)